MKKAVSLITAAALAAGTLGTLTASAHQADDGRYSYAYKHRPYAYFKTDESAGHVKLSDNFLYINKKNMPDEGETINVEVYMYDYTKKVCGVIVHLSEETGFLTYPKGYDPMEKYGSTPFIKYNIPGANVPHKPIIGQHLNGLSMSYQSAGLGYYELAGENTDDYPIGIVDALVSKDAPAGSYFVDFAPPDVTHFSDGTMMFSGFSETSEVYTDENDNYLETENFVFNYQCQNVQINVSDRDLGDTDDNGKTDEEDALDIMFLYSSLENGYKVMDNLAAASDVNGDRVIDPDDIEMVMDYTLLYGGEEQPEVSFVDYVKEQIGEE